jgi:hypothetical protein
MSARIGKYIAALACVALSACCADSVSIKTVPLSIKTVSAQTANCNVVASDGSVCFIFPEGIFARRDMQDRCKRASAIHAGDPLACQWQEVK